MGFLGRLLLAFLAASPSGAARPGAGSLLLFSTFLPASGSACLDLFLRSSSRLCVSSLEPRSSALSVTFASLRERLRFSGELRLVHVSRRRDSSPFEWSFLFPPLSATPRASRAGDVRPWSRSRRGDAGRLARSPLRSLVRTLPPESTGLRLFSRGASRATGRERALGDLLGCRAPRVSCLDLSSWTSCRERRSRFGASRFGASRMSRTRRTSLPLATFTSFCLAPLRLRLRLRGLCTSTALRRAAFSACSISRRRSFSRRSFSGVGSLILPKASRRVRGLGTRGASSATLASRGVDLRWHRLGLADAR
mmetsp:Transcript_38431/g.102269  ORF Transcript_38431/g.102269 Transcript_38431/m.102269 type:complete len:309 (+) Transcript_38431:284-1210(+)